MIVGIDLGDRLSHTHFLAAGSGESLDQGRIPTTKEGFTARFGSMPRARIALETGTHSSWVARLRATLRVFLDEHRSRRAAAVNINRGIAVTAPPKTRRKSVVIPEEAKAAEPSLWSHVSQAKASGASRNVSMESPSSESTATILRRKP